MKYDTKQESESKVFDLNKEKGFCAFYSTFIGESMKGIYGVKDSGWHVFNKESGNLYV